MRILLALLVFFLPLTAFAEESQLNAGLVSGIWYSKLPFFADETIRIYTAIQNSSGVDVKGKVQFLKNGEAIGETPFAAIKGGLTQAWIDWKAQEGSHTISAKIIEAVPPVSSSFAVASHEIFVDKDTDKDNIGNIQDTDDDNDNLTDEKEQTLGTDPLNPDTDGDTIKDGDDTIEQKAEEATNPIAQIEQETETFIENILEELETRKAQVVQRISDNEQKPILKLPSIPEQNIPSRDAVENFLLAAAITALPYWRIGLLLLGVIILWKILARFVF